MELDGKKVRKLMAIGSTVLMSLPREIVEKYNLKRGDRIIVEVDEQYRMKIVEKLMIVPEKV